MKGRVLVFSAIGIIAVVMIYFLTRKIRKTMNLETWDPKTDDKINTLHPMIREAAMKFINAVESELDIKLRVTSGLRTYKEQNALYAISRTTPGTRVTNAPGGHSSHNFGLAMDVVEIQGPKAIWDNPNWGKIAAIGKKHGFKWGGDWKSFKDKPHFYQTFGKSLADLRGLYEGNKKDGEYVKLA